MKKIKIEDYKNPNYSSLKMITGKILPAGLVISTMLTYMPNTVNANETEYLPPMASGGVPSPIMDVVEETPITVIINQSVIEFDVEPIMENDRVLVPLRKIFETLGATVTWDDETETATAIKGNDSIIIQVNNTKMWKNGEEITLDVAAKMIDDRVLVPIRAVAEGLDCIVLWDSVQHQVIIESKEQQGITVTAGAIASVNN